MDAPTDRPGDGPLATPQLGTEERLSRAAANFLAAVRDMDQVIGEIDRRSLGPAADRVRQAASDLRTKAEIGRLVVWEMRRNGESAENLRKQFADTRGAVNHTIAFLRTADLAAKSRLLSELLDLLAAEIQQDGSECQHATVDLVQAHLSTT